MLADEPRAVGSREGATAVGAARADDAGATAPGGRGLSTGSDESGASAGGRRGKVFTLDKMLQTEPHGVVGMGVQTDSLYARAAYAQTAPLHPPIDEGSQTDRAT